MRVAELVREPSDGEGCGGDGQFDRPLGARGQHDRQRPDDEGQWRPGVTDDLDRLAAAFEDKDRGDGQRGAQ